MSQKKDKLQRRQIKKVSKQIVQDFLKHVKEGWSLWDRIWLSCKIIFKGKLKETGNELKGKSTEYIFWFNGKSFYYSKWQLIKGKYIRVGWDDIHWALFHGHDINIRQATKSETVILQKEINKIERQKVQRQINNHEVIMHS